MTRVDIILLLYGLIMLALSFFCASWLSQRAWSSIWTRLLSYAGGFYALFFAYALLGVVVLFMATGSGAGDSPLYSFTTWATYLWFPIFPLTLAGLSLRQEQRGQK
ncbi:hypothetical protein [Thalassobius sp. MITS945101]|uniref:hypothetical protein n=1 Tax=Thalassobius sp. MITS945101 TaxID=3096994 RepID=UPI00399B691C